MKKVILFTIGTILSVSINAVAQEKKVSEPKKPIQRKTWKKPLYAGPSVSYGYAGVKDIPGNNVFQPARKFGLSFISERSRLWAWGAGLNVSAEGYKTRVFGGESSVTPVYLRLPVRGYYFFAHCKVRPYAYLGPEVGVKVAESSSGPRLGSESAAADNDHNQFRRFDAGINTGVGINLRIVPRMWINVDGGVYKGFGDAIEKTGGYFNENRNFTGTVSVLFAMKK